MGILQWARGSVHSPHMVATPLSPFRFDFLIELFVKQYSITIIYADQIIYFKFDIHNK